MILSSFLLLFTYYNIFKVISLAILNYYLNRLKFIDYGRKSHPFKSSSESNSSPVLVSALCNLSIASVSFAIFSSLSSNFFTSSFLQDSGIFQN